MLYFCGVIMENVFITFLNMFSHFWVIYVMNILHSVTIGIMRIPTLSAKKSLGGVGLFLAMFIACVSLSSCADEDDYYDYYDIGRQMV